MELVMPLMVGSNSSCSRIGGQWPKPLTFHLSQPQLLSLSSFVTTTTSIKLNNAFGYGRACWYHCSEIGGQGPQLQALRASVATTTSPLSPPSVYVHSSLMELVCSLKATTPTSTKGYHHHSYSHYPLPTLPSPLAWLPSPNPQLLLSFFEWKRNGQYMGERIDCEIVEGAWQWWI